MNFPPSVFDCGSHGWRLSQTKHCVFNLAIASDLSRNMTFSSYWFQAQTLPFSCSCRTNSILTPGRSALPSSSSVYCTPPSAFWIAPESFPVLLGSCPLYSHLGCILVVTGIWSPPLFSSLPRSFLRNLPTLKAADRVKRSWPEELTVCKPTFFFKVQGKGSFTFEEISYS